MGDGYVAVLVSTKKADGFMGDVDFFMGGDHYRKSTAELRHGGFEPPRLRQFDSVDELAGVLIGGDVHAVLIAGRNHKGKTDDALAMCNQYGIPAYLYGKNGNRHEATHRSEQMDDLLVKMHTDLARPTVLN